MKEYKAKDLFKEAKIEDVHINGKIGKQMDTFFEERVLSAFAKM